MKELLPNFIKNVPWGTEGREVFFMASVFFPYCLTNKQTALQSLWPLFRHIPFRQPHKWTRKEVPSQPLEKIEGNKGKYCVSKQTSSLCSALVFCLILTGTCCRSSSWDKGVSQVVQDWVPHPLCSHRPARFCPSLRDYWMLQKPLAWMGIQPKLFEGLTRIPQPGFPHGPCALSASVSLVRLPQNFKGKKRPHFLCFSNHKLKVQVLQVAETKIPRGQAFFWAASCLYTTPKAF